MLRQLAPQYIDTGKAKVVYRHYAFIGPESQSAAEAAECANDQAKFWDYANYLFTHQAGENVGAFSSDNLKNFAKQIGLDTAAFNSCLDGHKYAAAVKQESLQAQQRAVNSTPTFFFNGQRYVGLPTDQQFTALIDSFQR